MLNWLVLKGMDTLWNAQQEVKHNGRNKLHSFVCLHCIEIGGPFQVDM